MATPRTVWTYRALILCVRVDEYRKVQKTIMHSDATDGASALKKQFLRKQ